MYSPPPWARQMASTESIEMSDVLSPLHPTKANTPGGEPRTIRTSNAHIIAVTSGKGGVGKTFVSANLAAALTRLGMRVLVLDADLGLANLDVVLNLYPKVTLHDVFTGKASLQDAVVTAPGGFHVLLAGSGMVEYSRLTPEVRNQLIHVIDTLAPNYDVVLLDTGAGISDVVLFSVSLAKEVLIVATPEPTSLTDAYAAIKVLATQQKRQNMRLVINQAIRPGDGRAITGQLQQVLNRFVNTESGLPMRLIHMGDIPADKAVRDAVMRRQLLLQATPGCAAALAVAQLASRIKSMLPAPQPE
ncbi:cell division inhibitor MinD [Comamonas aquatica]|uniref:Cell division inhibitor MinD n=2 Tax=Comamonadaceae TaxID=80864 RepID=A0AA35GJF6_9BURK|nr:cell division inhibitor MinD [Comamonas aquatica]CAB5689906.1 cell division inhibitor MinD [Comamonas aquatica]CAC9214482.1 cell division inhibitor MinD [Comamonas aquatica]CAC9685468.1 cell division inhibitor MinD [Comamonas aquatica]